MASGNASGIIALRHEGGGPRMEIDIATANSPSAQAIAALGLAASLIESLVRGEPRTSRPYASIARPRWNAKLRRF
jgi:hypothetical protein